tara:strand:- start:229 stop:417 length:189 start_codon:yes stop_codon:yes gene_type:complete
VKAGDLVRYNKPSTRAEFDAVGLVVEIKEDWMKNWSKARVLWQGHNVAKWEALPDIKPFTSS